MIKMIVLKGQVKFQVCGVFTYMNKIIHLVH